ncbi:sulfotransferase family protein [Fodinibius saliphilus]|uniref:sulfotransferase family protein n=1 Tax=Fodinibius saliphilus TaxID=1920650 RepID=UPI001107FABB|nr:sulfotransferase domain-containing protein [Fodinibius saliphilus]
MEIDVFHIGPQKSATTWVYKCLKEHNEVLVPNNDSIHYYDMYFNNGKEWYASFFQKQNSKKIVIDPTPSYIRSPWAPRRIADDYPKAKFIVCLRHPIDRAFSHYWHEKKKQKIAFEFSEVLENYDLYSSWIEPGLYAEHIERYLQYFNEDQFLFLDFRDLKKDPENYLKSILSFLEVDKNFKPSFLDKKVNIASGKQTPINQGWLHLKTSLRDSFIGGGLRKLNLDIVARKLEQTPYLGKILKDKDEYEKGISPELRSELLEMIEPEIQRLEKLIGWDLVHWRK